MLILSCVATRRLLFIFYWAIFSENVYDSNGTNYSFKGCLVAQISGIWRLFSKMKIPIFAHINKKTLSVRNSVSLFFMMSQLRIEVCLIVVNV